MRSVLNTVVYFIRRVNNVFYNENNCQFRTISKFTMLNHVEECQLWDPSEIFDCSSDRPHAIIILNRPIRCDQNLIRNIWKTAQVTITVDGGTERWLTFLGGDKDQVLNGNCTEYLPNFVTGDMDSVSKETLARLESLGVEVIRTMDQNETDYTKSLRQLQLYCRERDVKLEVAYVIAETSGRLDQIIANISTLYKSQNIFHNMPIIQISKDSLTWLLKPGMHKIMIPDVLKNCNSWCSLLPVGYPAKSVSTTGLKWNLDKRCLVMDGMVSSSNTYSDQPCVTVSTDTTIIWSMGIKPMFNKIERYGNHQQKSA